jgi:hypothetical protein
VALDCPSRDDLRFAASETSIRVPSVPARMPPTKEIRCTDGDCFLDMFENHYTYDVPDEHSVADLQCPVCGGSDCLEEIEL